MPIYEYQCLEKGCEYCTPRFEVMQRMSDSHLTACPKCGEPVHRLISTIGIGTTRDSGSYSDAKKAGFTVLKKRDKGVYERL
ncbi:MAG: zinc ribbon domain-containing protein [Verrucomicrobiota bacterium]|nr:zinc ribbon domain-containing protein [Verrucomicrobiota bacterium]